MQVNFQSEYQIGVYAAIAINRYIALTQKNPIIVLYKKKRRHTHNEHPPLHPLTNLITPIYFSFQILFQLFSHVPRSFLSTKGCSFAG